MHSGNGPMIELLCSAAIIIPAGIILALIHYAIDRRRQRKRV